MKAAPQRKYSSIVQHQRAYAKSLPIASSKMDQLESSPIKIKAVEDARQLQSKVNEQCKKDGKDPPPYGLEELIGKGSFGRVYKGQVIQ